jgi:predicted NUDIX family phosphoesterase
VEANLCSFEPLSLKKNNSVAKINNSVIFNFKRIKSDILLKYKLTIRVLIIKSKELRNFKKKLSISEP